MPLLLMTIMQEPSQQQYNFDAATCTAAVAEPWMTSITKLPSRNQAKVHDKAAKQASRNTACTSLVHLNTPLVSLLSSSQPFLLLLSSYTFTRPT